MVGIAAGQAMEWTCREQLDILLVVDVSTLEG